MDEGNVLLEDEKKPSKRGRKPSGKKKYYFDEEEELAFMEYVSTVKQGERDRIFRDKLYPAFSKMVESIIRTYILFTPSEEFEETFHDTMSFLITKVNNFDPKSGKIVIWYDIVDDKVTVNDVEYVVDEEKVTINGREYFIKDNKVAISYPVKNNKAIVNGVEYDVENEKVIINDREYNVEYYKLFSYCGTVCKNYLMFKRNQCKKKRDKQLSYDMLFPTADKDNRIDSDEKKNLLLFNNELIDKTISEIQMMLAPENIDKLNENEQRIGYALLEMLMNWEEIFIRLENKKFNKTSVWYFLKEYTQLNSKEIRDGMKKFKNVYFFTKEKMINE